MKILVLYIVPLNYANVHTIRFFTDEGKVYKIVQWQDLDGETHSELIDILEGVHPESVKAMDISSMVINDNDDIYSKPEFFSNSNCNCNSLWFSVQIYLCKFRL